KLLARERVELLLDRDSPFLELSTVAAWGTSYHVGASIVTGLGVVSNVECVITAHDPTVRGGASNPWTWKKVLRALEIARENRLPLINIVESLNRRKLGPPPTMTADEPIFAADELAGIVSIDLKIPFDPREVLARVVDGSRFEEYKPLYGPSLVTGWASVHGYLVGVIANARGVLFSEESHKVTEFILLCNEIDTPLVFLQNTTGYMVGRDYEQRGIIKDGAKMINAVTNSTVPHITIYMGASYGAGNYGMSGRSYSPRFLF